jgi:hypothetical protein
VEQVEQGRGAEEDQQAERQRDAQQRHGGHGECGQRGQTHREREVQHTHALGVGDGDAGQLTGQACGLGAAARVEHPVGHEVAQPLVGAHVGEPGAAGPEPVAGGQEREVQPEHGQPEQ